MTAAWVPLLALVALLLVFVPSAAAVHLEGLFELDGNAVDQAAPGEDWSTIYGGGTVTGTASDFITDLYDSNSDTIFTGGSTKDDLDVSGWLCKTGNAVDKNDIEHAYASAYVKDGETFVYFGADKFSTSGDAQIGFWFFQSPVGCSPGVGDTSFTGTHEVGDLLVLSDFTNGGNVSNIRVFMWVGSGGDTNGTLELIATAADCDVVLANDDVCAQVNPVGGETAPWPYTPKSNLGPPGAFPKGAFYEGGINLTALLGAANVPCLGTFLTETRQSQSVDSVLEDFALGQLNTCPDVTIHKTPDNGKYFVGDAFDWELLVTNNGAAASNVVVTDTIPAGLTINSATYDVDPNTAGGTGSCVIVAQLVTCTIASLAGSDGNTTGAEPDTALVKINVTATAAAGPGGSSAACATVNNTGSVTADREPDELDDDNSNSGSVSVCRLGVTKTANPSFTRTYQWDVNKIAAGDGSLTLAAGETYIQRYDVTYTVTGHTDSNWRVSGIITINSPANAPNNRTVNILDSYAGSAVPAANLACTVAGGDVGAVANPYTDFDAGETLSCTWFLDLGAATTGTNTATARLTNIPSGTTDFTGTATVSSFGAPTTEIDESILAEDNVPLAQVCTAANTPVAGCIAPSDAGFPPSATLNRSASPKTFTYYRIIVFSGPEACGEHDVDNTAKLTTNDTGTTDTSNAHIDVTVRCPQGCTLTQGYWKTHSEKGPAPYDDTWALLANGADTQFFNLTGEINTWYEVFWTPPSGGNAFLQLAHQYMAAYLNTLNGADPSAISQVLVNAANLLDDYTTIPEPKSISKTTRTAMQTLASTLAAYNEGATGPGHCDEDSTSAA